LFRRVPKVDIMRAVAFFVTMFLVALTSTLRGADPLAAEARPVGLDGQPVDPFQSGKATVLLFVRTDCPISNRYAPEVRRLHDKYESQGFNFWLVYPDPDETSDEIRQHVKEFAYPCRVLRDPEHVMVRLSKASVTPESAVFTTDGRLIYHGRIDDRYVDLGRKRPAPSARNLEEVLSSLARGEHVSASSAPAVGCAIPTLP
jgi:hypothetical protein